MNRTRTLAWLAWISLAGLLVVSAADAETVYFLVAETSPAHGDSYVLPLSDPADIQHARDLIRLGPALAGAPIAVARIAAGSDGINRDHLSPGLPEWSWHVTQLDGFADFTIEILDGWPGFVEQDVPGWIANTNGRIGFWTYTVVAELPAPVQVPVLSAPLGWLLAGCLGLASAGVIRPRSARGRSTRFSRRSADLRAAPRSPAESTPERHPPGPASSGSGH